jgi:hypothetical protein
MSRFVSMRLAVSVVLASALLPAVAFTQSQDSQSVAEAARRAREQKKTPAKPAKVITEDDVKPFTPAASEAAPASGTQASPAVNTSAAQAPGGSAAPDAKDEKSSKEIADLKEKIKQAQSDLDLLQRQLSLEQDNYFSKSDYTHDTAGKAKVDGLKLQVGDKRQELDGLKARLAELHPPPAAPPAAPPKS